MINLVSMKNGPLEQKYACKFCNKKFHREETLVTHLCVKKQRYNDRDNVGARLGFRAYQTFYKLESQAKAPKTLDDFIGSNLYTDFVKFGNHLANLKPMYIEKFVEYVIKNRVKLKDWSKDIVYYTYIEEFVKTEPATSAVDRTIEEILEWCEKNNSPFKDFFSNISPNEAAFLIKIGRISPWVLYLASSGEKLMNSFNQDHAKMISDIIDPGFWMKKFKKQEDDVDFLRGVLDEAGL